MRKIFTYFSRLRPKLILAFALTLIIPGLIIGAMAYSTAREAVEEEIQDGFRDSIRLLDSSITETIEQKVHDVSTFTGNTTAQHFEQKNIPALRQRLAQYAELHPEVIGTYIGTSSGAFIEEPQITDTSTYDPRTRDWYKEAMDQQGETVISKPYQDVTTGSMVVTISRTTDDGSGVMGVDLLLDHVQGLVNQLEIGEEGYAFLMDTDHITMAHPTVESGTEITYPFIDQLYKEENGQFGYEYEGDEKLANFATNELTGWKIAGTISKSETEEAAAPILRKTLIVIAVAYLVGAALIYLIIKSIIRPLNNLKEQAITISNGDLTEPIQVTSKDEIGQLGEAFQTMQQNLKQLIRNIEENAEQVAASSEQLTASAEQTSTATEQVAVSIQQVAGNAEQHSNGAEETVQSLNEVSTGVTQIADHSSHVAELAQRTIEQAEEGEKAVTSTVDQMKSIHASVAESDTMIQSLYERSKEVSAILDVITQIADQTNLLALNAAIEAARAGENGKGFAVVADEVRKLAEQSQSSASEIMGIVQGIQQDTKSSVEIMARVTDDVQTGVQISNEAIEKFNEILHSTKEITPQMQEVSATAQQMSAAVQQVTATTHDLTMIAKENAAASEEVAATTEEQLAAMEEISASARSLSTMADELKRVIASFKY
ncbi:methyl-accepting chemotaxis protein [Bacillus thermotolerans]|uniref:Methyl-accepting chemotaxis protein n=1 Tax=Bacillus thermotolerans TaxID=1221996 RepID=A0A0F5I7Q9_BACTR|nr:methyl-accepting chemotaxis protein [Bacillus thermotolerans]KKB41325.1 methyl-accepting chemotaxis protein [Bacillus thermotolerans]